MRKSFILLIFVIPLLLFACNKSLEQGDENKCPLPPQDFSKADVVGTWKTGWSKRNDTLIIKEDGSYKQIIHVETPAFDYESDWLPWNYEVSGNGIPLLHLHEMRLCVYWNQIDCYQSGGGENDWYNFCSEEWVQMSNEGILMVLGSPKNITLPPPGVSLFALTRSTEDVVAYTFQNP